MNRIIKPILKLKNAASQMMKGDYSVRTYITGNDEIAITAQTFDSMAESIQKNDSEKSQLFINLSHELKTPLNVILASLRLIDKFHATAKTCTNYNKI
ncbi:MAG: HAMP domain-containing protein, partial [Clostridiales bacterium]|nr:HAMP domain-containing protein [Clostridiales bacterium]